MNWKFSQYRDQQETLMALGNNFQLYEGCIARQQWAARSTRSPEAHAAALLIKIRCNDFLSATRNALYRATTYYTFSPHKTALVRAAVDGLSEQRAIDAPTRAFLQTIVLPDLKHKLAKTQEGLAFQQDNDA